MPDYVEIIPHVFVGNRMSCNRDSWRFHQVIHIWRDDVLHVEDHQCKAVRDGMVRPDDLVICYSDGRSLITNARPPLPKIEKYLSTVSPNKDLLIHCMAGITRSNTIALVALLQRGLPLGVALELIYVKQWEGRKVAANICHTPMEDILQFFDY